MKKRIISVSGVLLMLCVLVICCMMAQKSHFTESPIEIEYLDNGDVRIGEGLIAYGFYTTAGDIVDNSAEIECTDGKIEGTYKFHQNTNQTNNFGMIIMCDYIQNSFTVQKKAYDFYTFSATGDEELEIPITVDVPDEAAEIEIMIITEPYAELSDLYVEDEFNWNNMYASKSLMVQRYSIKGREKKAFKKTELKDIAYDGNIGFDLVDDKIEIPTVFCKKNSGDTAKIALGCGGLNIEEYVVVAFCDWKQVAIAEGEKVCCFNYTDGKNGYYSITMPEAEKSTPYQMFAFGNPNHFMSYEWASFRIILNE